MKFTAAVALAAVTTTRSTADNAVAISTATSIAIVHETKRFVLRVFEFTISAVIHVVIVASGIAEAAAAGQPVRADDNEESLKIRLMEYYKKTSPLIGYYHAKGDLKSVDGLGELDTVTSEIAAALDA